jgi:hypothetical protein
VNEKKEYYFDPGAKRSIQIPPDDMALQLGENSLSYGICVKKMGRVASG